MEVRGSEGKGQCAAGISNGWEIIPSSCPIPEFPYQLETLRSQLQGFKCAHVGNVRFVDVGARTGEFVVAALNEVGLSRLDCELQRSGIPTPGRAFRGLGRKWGGAVSAYARHLPPVPKRWLMTLLQKVEVRICEECWIEWMKLVSSAALANVMAGLEGAKFFCGWHVLGGYDTILNRADVVTQMVKEAAEEKEDTDGYLARLRKKVRNRVRRSFVSAARADWVDWKTFVANRDVWGLPGACTHGERHRLTFKHRSGATKNIHVGGKFWGLVRLSNVAIRKLAEQEPTSSSGVVETKIFPFRKLDEPVKTRAVQSYDFRSYLRCCFLTHGIDSLGKNCTWTTAGAPLGEKNMLRRRVLTLLSSGIGTAISIDQTNFDWNQSWASVKVVAEEVISEMIRRAPERLKQDFERIGRIELQSLERPTIWGRVRGKPKMLGTWRRGVPSGLRWTALIDSLISDAVGQMVAEDAGWPVLLQCVQGDDALLVVKGGGPTPEAVSSGYRRYGLDVNPHKTWVNRYAAEFLQEVYRGRRVIGFPARVFKSLLWKKPATGGVGSGALDAAANLGATEVGAAGCPLVGEQYSPSEMKPAGVVVSEWVATVRKAVRRGCVGFGRELLSRCSACAVREQGKELKGIKKSEGVREFLFTPVAFGGGGFGEGGRKAGVTTTEGLGDWKLDRRAVGKRWGWSRQMWGGLFARLLAVRAVQVVPLPGAKAGLDLRRVKGPEHPLSISRTFMRPRGRIRKLWPPWRLVGRHVPNEQSFGTGKAAAKISTRAGVRGFEVNWLLELARAAAVKIGREWEWLPDPGLRGLGERGWRLWKLLWRLGGAGVVLEDWKDSLDGGAHLMDVCNRYWHGFLAMSLHYLNFEAAEAERAVLQKWAYRFWVRTRVRGRWAI